MFRRFKNFFGPRPRKSQNSLGGFKVDDNFLFTLHLRFASKGCLLLWLLTINLAIRGANWTIENIAVKNKKNWILHHFLAVKFCPPPQCWRSGGATDYKPGWGYFAHFLNIYLHYFLYIQLGPLIFVCLIGCYRCLSLMQFCFWFDFYIFLQLTVQCCQRRGDFAHWVNSKSKTGITGK